MQLQIKLIMIVSILCIGISNTKADGFPDRKVLVKNAPTENQWLVVKNEDGFVFSIREEKISGSGYISIKVENLSGTDRIFSFELVNQGKSKNQEFLNYHLNSFETKIFFDPTVTLQLESSETIDQYTINIL